MVAAPYIAANPQYMCLKNNRNIYTASSLALGGNTLQPTWEITPLVFR